MIYLLFGTEYYLIKEKLEDIKSKHNIDNIINLDYETNKMHIIMEEIYNSDLFSSKKLVIVSNFSFKKLNSEEEKLLNSLLDNSGDNILVLKCIDESLDNRKSIIKKMYLNAEIFEAKKLDRWALTTKLKEMFKKDNYIINEEHIKKIINICGFNNYIDNNDYIFNEVNKLMLYKLDDKTITDNDLSCLSKNTDNELFNLINAVIAKDVKLIFEEFKIIKELNIDAFVIVISIAKQYRQLMQIKVLMESMSLDAIARKLGIHPYIVELHSKNVNMYSYSELADRLEKMCEIDEIIKSENIDKYKILEEYFVNLE